MVAHLRGATAASVSEPQEVDANGYRITLFRQGADAYAKSRHPLVYGRYHEIETPEAILHFNLRGQIFRARGKPPAWPHAEEWLKRTEGNDWVYYAGGGFSGRFEAVGQGELDRPIQFRVPTPYNEIHKTLGEYYLPHLPYPSNNILNRDALSHPDVRRLIQAWPEMVADAARAFPDPPGDVAWFLQLAQFHTPDRLQESAERVFRITHGRIRVIPPDARHVDYDIVPLTVAEGCLYKCRFCRVKNRRPFRPLSPWEIREQIAALRTHFGPDLENRNALFLGDQDALHAGPDRILETAETAIAALGLRTSALKGTHLFLFGSVDAFLAAEDRFFDALNRSGVRTFINLGLESADPDTLEQIGKPITARQVADCFFRALALNDQLLNVEITCNFLMGGNLPPGNEPAFLRLVRDGVDRPRNKGTVYLSPLSDRPASLRTMFAFYQLQRMSRLPTFLYLLQRL